ncbi:MAG: hypothetical protein SGCHY_004958 [Lobulomycetales sp.]
MSLPHLLIFTADSPSPKLPSHFLPPILPARRFATHLITSFQDAAQLLATQNTSPSLIILECEGGDDVARKATKDLIRRVRYGTGARGKRPFILLWSKRASRDAREQWYWTSQGVNMVCHDVPALARAIDTVLYLVTPQRGGPAKLMCPYCADEMDLPRLHVHVAMYHSHEPDGTVCTLCETSTADLPVHLRAHHALDRVVRVVSQFPAGVGAAREFVLGEVAPPAAAARIPVFVLVVCKRASDGRYLLTNELKGQGWYLPGGRVSMGEDLQDAARRETRDETGVEVEIKGVLRTEYTPSKHGMHGGGGANICAGFRVRVVFYAEPVRDEDSEAKSMPNEKSSGACWVTCGQVDQREAAAAKPGFSNISLPVRGPEAVEWIQYVESGGAIWPVQSVTGERDSVVFIDDPWMDAENIAAAATSALEQRERLQEKAVAPRKKKAPPPRERDYGNDSSSELYLDQMGGDTAASASEVPDLAAAGDTSAYEHIGESDTGTVKVTLKTGGDEDSDHFDWHNNNTSKPAKRKEIVQRMESDATMDLMLPDSARRHRNLIQK